MTFLCLGFKVGGVSEYSVECSNVALLDARCSNLSAAQASPIIFRLPRFDRFGVCARYGEMPCIRSSSRGVFVKYSRRSHLYESCREVLSQHHMRQWLQILSPTPYKS